MRFQSFGNGKDGAVASANGVVNTYSTMTATAGNPVITTNLSVAVGDMVLLHQTQGTGYGNYETVIVKTVGSGNFTATTNPDNSYVSGAQAIKVPQYSGGTLANTLTPTAWDGSIGGVTAIAVNGTLTLNGGINANGGDGADNSFGITQTTGGGFRGSGGIDAAVPAKSSAAEGSATGWTPTVYGTAANGQGGGGVEKINTGTGAGNGAAGGGGSYGGAGSDGTQHANWFLGKGATTTGGAADGTTAGFGGGGGGGGVDATGVRAGAGGAGGGIVLIFANVIKGSGVIQTKGGKGGSGTDGSYNGGGGAGAGGHILLFGEQIDLTSLVLSYGGGTGFGGGGNGGNGRASAFYSNSISKGSNTITDTLDSSVKPQGGGAIINLFI